MNGKIESIHCKLNKEGWLFNMKQYTTIQGDTWDMIAYKVYGNEYRMKELMACNLKYIDVAVFSAGINLITPTIENPVSSKLPPWKR